MAVGDVVFYPAQIVTGIAGVGGVAKGDLCKITAISGKTPTFTKVAAATDFLSVMALEAVAEGEQGAFLCLAPVVYLDGQSTVTIGAWLTIDANGRVIDASNTAGSVAWVPLVGIAWSALAAGTGPVLVQLMPAIFSTYMD